MSILLTEEMLSYFKDQGFYPPQTKAMAKAQLLKVYNWGNKVGFIQEQILIGEAMRNEKYPKQYMVIPLDKWQELKV